MNQLYGGHDDAYRPTTLTDYIKDPRRLMRVMQRNKKGLIAWLLFFSVAYAIFSFSSSRDFSFTLTLGSLVSMFGFFLLALKVYSTGSVSGLSLNSVKCSTLCLFSRLLSISFYEGYLPYDATGDFIYRLAEYASFACSALVLYLMMAKFTKSYNRDLDTFQWYWFAGPALFLAILFHPNLNGHFHSDVPWTFALYLESIAMFPQLDLFRKKGGEIESFTSHYVASTGFSRILHFVFWLATFGELNEDRKTSSFLPNYVGYIVVLFQFIQILLIAEFLYHFLKSVRAGIPMTLPTYYSNA